MCPISFNYRAFPKARQISLPPAIAPQLVRVIISQAESWRPAEAAIDPFAFPGGLFPCSMKGTPVSCRYLTQSSSSDGLWPERFCQFSAAEKGVCETEMVLLWTVSLLVAAQNVVFRT